MVASVAAVAAMVGFPLAAPAKASSGDAWSVSGPGTADLLSNGQTSNPSFSYYYCQTGAPEGIHLLRLRGRRTWRNLDIPGHGAVCGDRQRHVRLDGEPFVFRSGGNAPGLCRQRRADNDPNGPELGAGTLRPRPVRLHRHLLVLEPDRGRDVRVLRLRFEL